MLKFGPFSGHFDYLARNFGSTGNYQLKIWKFGSSKIQNSGLFRVLKTQNSGFFRAYSVNTAN